MPSARTLALVLAAALPLLGQVRPASGDATLTSKGGEVAEASQVVRVGLGWPLATVDLEQVLVNRGSEPGLASYQFELPAGAVITGLEIDPGKGGVARGNAIDATAARRALPDPPAGAVPDLALLHLIGEPARAEADARSRYELRLYPVAAGRSLKATVHVVIPTTYHDDRLMVRLPGRGDGDGLVRARVTAEVVAGPDLAAGRELRVAGALATGPRSPEIDAPSLGDVVIEARPRWKRSTPFARAATVPRGQGEAAGLVVAIAVPTTPPTDLDAFARVVVVVDASLSLGPDGRALAARITRSLLDRASPSAEIEVVAFDRAAHGLLGGLRTNDAATRTAAADALARQGAAAGSDLGVALDHVGRLLSRAGEVAPRADDPAGDRRRTLIAILTDGLLPTDLDARAVVSQLGKTALADATVAPIVLVPDGASLPAVSDGLEALAARSSGRILFVRHDEAERADRLFDELGTPPPLASLALVGPDDAGLDLELPTALDRGEGVVAIGQARATASLELSAGRAGKTIRLALARDAGLTRRATALVARRDGVRDAASPEDAIRRSDRAGVVSARTSLVAFAPDDGFGRDRLALARKWGAGAYRRIAPPLEVALPNLDVQPDTGVRAAARVTGALDRSIVQSLLATQLLPRARACYHDLLRRQPGKSGHLVVTAEMARGEVHFARVSGLDLGDPALRSCVLDAAYAIKVPTVAMGTASEAIFVTRYPLEFEIRGRRGHVVADPGKRDEGADLLDDLPVR